MEQQEEGAGEPKAQSGDDPAETREGHRSAVLTAAFMLLLALVLAVLPISGESVTVFHEGDLSQKLLTAQKGTARPGDVPPRDQAKQGGLAFVETPAVDIPAGRLRVEVRYDADAEGNFLKVVRRSDGELLKSLPLPASGGEADLFLELPEALPGVTAGVSYGGRGHLSVSRLSLGMSPALPGPWEAPVVQGLCLLLAALGLAWSLWLCRRAPEKEKPRGLKAVVTSRRALFVLGSAAVLPLVFLGPIWFASGASPGLHSANAGLTALCLTMAFFPAAAFGLSLRSMRRGLVTLLVFAAPFALLALATVGSESGDYCLGNAFRAGLRLLAVLFVLEGLASCAAASGARRVREGHLRWVLAFTAAEILALLPPLVLVVYRLAFGQTFARPAIEAIWQTNPHEALRFASAFVPHLIALVIAAAAIVKGLWTLNVRRLSRLTSEASASPAPSKIFVRLASSSLVLLLAGIVREAASAPVGVQFAETFQYFRRIAARQTPAHATSRQPEPEGAAQGPKTHLLVIGESAGRDRLGLYGYERETTPWLASMAAERGLLVFRSAYAGSKYTYHALEMALTEADQYDRRRFEDSLTLVEALRAAGYTVTWLSNQERDFNRGMPFGIMASSCDVSRWTAHPAESFDMDLVKLLSESVDPSKKNVVIVHMNGSHLVYRDRTPEEARRFSAHSDSIGDAYDDSVLYTDSVLSALFAYAEAHLNLSTFTYFSDHGEVPGVPRDTFLWGMARIPFAVWMSEDYRRTHGELAARLASRIDDFWTNDLFFDLALSLYGVASDRREAAKDLSSPQWQMRGSDLTTENGRYFVCGDPGLADWKDCVGANASGNGGATSDAETR